MGDLLCVHCGHTFPVAGATRRKSVEFVVMVIVIVIGVALLIMSAATVWLGFFEHRLARGDAIWKAGMAFLGGIGFTGFGFSLPKLAPYVCPSCHKPRGFADDSVQANYYRQKKADAAAGVPPARKPILLWVIAAIVVVLAIVAAILRSK